MNLLARDAPDFVEGHQRGVIDDDLAIRRVVC